jgi:hypothetical protein
MSDSGENQIGTVSRELHPLPRGTGKLSALPVAPLECSKWERHAGPRIPNSRSEIRNRNLTSISLTTMEFNLIAADA